MPHKSLRQGRMVRTPAMVIGLTDHGWSYRESIWLPVHADPSLTAQLDERMAHLLTPALPDQPPGRTHARPAVETNAKEAVLMWLYSPGHTETQNSHVIRGVFDEPTHDEKISRRV
jgi:hypothetical protein